MMRRKITTLLASIILILSFSVTLFAAIIAESIKENHQISLSPDLMKLSSASNGTYESSLAVANNDIVYVKNNEQGYDLVALSTDQTDGFVVATNENNPLNDDKSISKSTITSDKFKPAKSYYLVALMHHSYNRYVSSFLELEVLNNEYRHNAVNDDLMIGNVTDLYDKVGSYIGDLRSYDIYDATDKLKIYDYYGNVVKSVIDIKTLSNTGPLSYDVSTISSSTTVDMRNIRRSDIYKSDKSRYTGVVKLADTTKVYDNEFNNPYGRAIKQLYYLEPIKDSSNNIVSYKESSYIFGNDGVNNTLIINGTELDITQLDPNEEIEIDLSKCYYEDGLVVDNAYKSKVYKNIYLLNNIETNKDLTLIMPCNIILLNNNIILNNDIKINHYYHGNYFFSNLTISGKTGNFVDKNGTVITDSSEHAVTFECPNATFESNMYINEVKYADEEESMTHLYADALAFAKGFFYVDCITKDDVTYSVTYNNPILPKNFYDEDIEITYLNEDGSDFIVERNPDNIQKLVKICINGVEVDEVNMWIVGDSTESIAESLAKEIEYDLNTGFKTSATSRIYINYDKIAAMITTNTLNFESVNGIEVSEAYLEVLTPTSNNETFNLYTRSGAGTDLDPYVYTKVLPNASLSNTTTYYEKYLLFERASYTFSKNAYANVKVKISNGITENENNIKIKLSPISKELYISHLKQEIGQIYFEDESTYKLKSEADLAKYDVKTITYTTKIKEGLDYFDTDALPIENYEISNLGMVNGANYYVLVEVKLTDGSPISFYTDKVVANATAAGGDGENEYKSALFEKEFNDMSVFIGLSNDFVLEDDIYYYLKIASATNPSYADFVRLYRKVIPASDIDAKALIDGNRTYYYLDSSDLSLHEITSASEVTDTTPLYTLPLDTDNIQNDKHYEYHMVFLTESDNIPKTSTQINVKAYITDSSELLTGESLIKKVQSLNLYNGLYDFNKNPIDVLTNGKEKYIFTYNSSKQVTKVEYVDSIGTVSTVSTSDLVDISGFYHNGYVYDLISNGEKIFIKNGIYSNKIISEGTKVETYNYGILTFNLDYTLDRNSSMGYISSVIANFDGNQAYLDKNGDAITSSSYDLSNGLYTKEDNVVKPLRNVMLSNASFTFIYDSQNECTGYVVNYATADSTLSGYFYRIPTQQTTFYDLSGGILTIYVQDYSFTVPGVYRPGDFNAKINSSSYAEAVDETGETLIANNPNVYDMYETLMDIYGQFNGSGVARGFKEINGSKYFLLVSDLDNAETIANYDDTGALILDENNDYTNLDCSMKTVNIVNLITKLPKIKNIYIKNARFAHHTHITSIDGTDSVVELSLDNIRGTSDNIGFQSDLHFKNYTNLEKIIITNSKLTTITGIYRKVKYIDLSNNLLTNIDFIKSGVILEYVNLKNNKINTFEPLKALTALKYLYVTGNDISTSVTLGSNTIYPYGTPRKVGDILYGQINIPILVETYEKNSNITETDYDNFLFNQLNDGNINYLYSVYTANAIGYLTTYYYGLELDLALIYKAGYATQVYASKDNTTYVALESSNSTQYSYASGYYVTTDTEYIYAIISISKGGYTIYREIYFTTS